MSNLAKVDDQLQMCKDFHDFVAILKYVKGKSFKKKTVFIVVVAKAKIKQTKF